MAETLNKCDILTMIKMLDEGVIPYIYAGLPVTKSLSAMSPDEARVTKRRFRKLLRRCIKHMGKPGKRLSNMAKMGRPKTELRPSDFHIRRQLVLRAILQLDNKPDSE